MWRPTFLILSLLAAGPAWADVAPLSISEDTTWSLAQSPVEVQATCRVYEGVTLTIEAGVQVQLGAGATLRISGALVAVGTEEAPIVFTGSPLGGDEVAAWQSVVFEDTSEDAIFEAVDQFVGGSIVERCRFDHATRALVLEAASPYVHANEFVGNRCDCDDTTVGGAAMHIGPGSAPRVRDNLFEGNSVGSLAWGGAVYANNSAPLLQGNSFVGNRGPYGAGFCGSSLYAPIVGNRFVDNITNWEGGAVSLYSSSPAFFGNEVVANEAVFDGGGLHICIDCFPHATPLMMDNVITDNLLASEFGAAGFGAAYLRVFRDNDVYGNFRAGLPSDFAWHNEWLEDYPDWVTSPDISNNWWGTTDAAAIDATIHDGRDEEGLGIVTWDPPLDGPIGAPQTRVGLTTTRLRYHQDGLEMPIFLTLYNPGPSREVDLLLLLQYGGGAAMPYLGEPAFPGAERRGDVLRLTLPEDSVWFGTVVEPGYDPAADVLGHGTWHAALLDSATGAALDDAVSARIDFEPGDEVRR